MGSAGVEREKERKRSEGRMKGRERLGVKDSELVCETKKKEGKKERGEGYGSEILNDIVAEKRTEQNRTDDELTLFTERIIPYTTLTSLNPAQ